MTITGQKVVGIPRALAYYQFPVLWEKFLTHLDAKVVISGETNRAILDGGVAKVADEACLPVKIYFGHTAFLVKRGVDYLFVPRIVSIERGAYICPKLMGLPDMVEAGIRGLPPLIKPTMNLVGSSQSLAAFRQEVGKILMKSPRQIEQAWQEAVRQQEAYDRAQINTPQAHGARLSILLLGHHYILDDPFLNFNITAKLEALGCQVLTPAQMYQGQHEATIKGLSKQLFWTYGRVLLGSISFFSQRPGLKGVIKLTSFGCGIDSFVDYLIMRNLKQANVPFLNISLDEHSGEAGLCTRVEAFVDMLKWRQDVTRLSS